MNMDVDIIIVTFNRLQMLKELLFSIESQSCPPDKVIIYDDVSTDGTVEFLNTYTGKLNLHVLLGKSKSENVAVSRNKCLEIVTSPYVIVSDDDDLMPPDKVERLKEGFKSSGAKMITGDTIIFDGQQQCEKFSKPVQSDGACKLNRTLFYAKNPLQWASIAFETAALKEVGGFDSRFTMITDWTVYLRLMEKYDCWYFPDILGYYRIHLNNMSTNISALISDLEIFSGDQLGIDSGAGGYLAMSQYMQSLSERSIFRAISVVWACQTLDMTLLRKVKLTLVAFSGCYKYLSALRAGSWSKLGSYDKRLPGLLN